METRYYPAFTDFKNRNISKCFIINRNDNKTCFIGKQEAELFNTLNGCKTIQEHLEEIMQTVPENIPYSAVSNVLKQWISSGLLREERLLEKSRFNSPSESSSGQSTLFSCCITCNRPFMIERWLDTRTTSDDYINNKIDIAVLDDSDNTKTVKSNIETVKERQKTYPGRILYIGKEEKSDFSDTIKKSLHGSVTEEIIDFSLNPGRRYFDTITTGSNRNSFILLTAGFSACSNDDDLEYRIYSKKDSNPEEFVFSENYTSEAVYYPDMKTLNDNVREDNDFSIISNFNDLALSDSVFRNNRSFSNSLSTITPHIAMLMEKDELKLRTATAGYCGGRWHSNPYFPLLRGRTNIFNNLENLKNYEETKMNGFNIVAPESFVLDYSDFLMGGTFWINNNELIPPCFPLGRREDSNLGMLIHRCLEPGLSLHMPYALYHNPSEKKAFDKDYFNDISLDSGVYTTLILDKYSSALISDNGEGKLKELGFRIMEIGKLDTAEFEEQLKLLQLGYLTKTMNHVSYLLDLYNSEPSWWAEDMEKYSRLLESEALKENSVAPRELRVYETKDKALTVFKDYLYKCGEMLYWWPEIWEAARELNIDGKGLMKLK